MLERRPDRGESLNVRDFGIVAVLATTVVKPNEGDGNQRQDAADVKERTSFN